MNKEEVVIWSGAVKLCLAGKMGQALQEFLSIRDYAKVAFNIALIHQQQNDHSLALDFFDEAIDRDPYFALAYQQRAYSLFITEQHELAFDDYKVASDLLLENKFIDYTQLGLGYKLYKAEVVYNRAMCHLQMGDQVSVVRDIQEAKEYTETEDQKEVIKAASRIGLQSDIILFSLPRKLFFNVSDSKSKNAGEKKFLKEAVVVANASQDDSEYNGFSGAQILSRENAQLAKKPTTQSKSDRELVELGKSATKRYPSPPLETGRRPSVSDYEYERERRPSFARTTGKGTLLSSRGSSISAPSPTNRRPSDININERIGIPSSTRSANQKKGNWASQTNKPISPISDDSFSNNGSSSSSASSKSRFKVNYRGDVFVIVLTNGEMTFGNLVDKVERKLKLSDAFSLSFVDDDGARYIIGDDDDVEMARETCQLWVNIAGEGGEVYDLY